MVVLQSSPKSVGELRQSCVPEDTAVFTPRAEKTCSKFRRNLTFAVFEGLPVCGLPLKEVSYDRGRRAKASREARAYDFPVLPIIGYSERRRQVTSAWVLDEYGDGERMNCARPERRSCR